MDNIRPAFLTVLCVLTFLGSSVGIYSAFTNYTSAEMATGMTHEAIDEIQDKLDQESKDEKGAEIANKMIDSMSKNLTVDKLKTSAIGSGISNILTLIGAILMWGLSKRGFFVYIFGALVGIFTPIIVYDGVLGAVASGGMALISIIFCILYFVNLKHLS